MAKAIQQPAIPRVKAEHVMRRIDRGEPVIFVDSRNPQAWSESNEKLPGAIRIPVGEVARRLGEIPNGEQGGRKKDQYIVAYCT
jgi:rhodanese-related sulfurtransferase